MAIHAAIAANNLADVEAACDIKCIEERNAASLTPLMAACDKGNADIVTFIVRKGADVTATDKRGWTPLIYAASNGYADIIRVLFQYGCETALHAEDRDGWNAVIHAAANGHAPVVDMLVHAGAATTTTDGTTARSVAEKRGFPDVLRVLDARSATASPESSAVTTPTLSTQTAVGFSASPKPPPGRPFITFAKRNAAPRTTLTLSAPARDTSSQASDQPPKHVVDGGVLVSASERMPASPVSPPRPPHRPNVKSWRGSLNPPKLGMDKKTDGDGTGERKLEPSSSPSSPASTPSPPPESPVVTLTPDVPKPASPEPSAVLASVAAPSASSLPEEKLAPASQTQERSVQNATVTAGGPSSGEPKGSKTPRVKLGITSWFGKRNAKPHPGSVVTSPTPRELINVLGQTQLMLACKRGDLAAVTRLCADNTVNVNAKDKNGRTPLMYACDVDGVSEGTCEDLLRVLLNAGATAGVFTQNVMGLDALSLLVTAGRYNLMETLLDVVEPLCADNQPMRFAMSGSIVAARRLAQACGAPRKVTAYLQTRLATLDGHGLTKSPEVKQPPRDGMVVTWTLESEYPDALATLAAKGDLKGILARSKQAEFQVDEPAPDTGMTGLTAACDNMKVRTATTLLELGANPNVITKAGWTPLMYAVSRGCTPIILALISANADVNFADKSGVTPLMLAAGADQVDTVAQLLRHGADVNAVNHWGMSAIMGSIWYGSGDVVPLLLEHGCDITKPAKSGVCRDLDAVMLAVVKDLSDVLQQLEHKEKGCVAAAKARLEAKAEAEAAEAERIRQATLKFKAHKAWGSVVALGRSAKGRVQDAVKQRKLAPLCARTPDTSVPLEATQAASDDAAPALDVKSYDNPLRSSGGGAGEGKEPEVQQPFPHTSLFANYRNENVSTSRRNSLTRGRSRSRSASPIHPAKPAAPAALQQQHELDPVLESK